MENYITNFDEKFNMQDETAPFPNFEMKKHILKKHLITEKDLISLL